MPTNRDIVLAHYAGLVNRDLDAVMAPLADDIAWIEADGSPLAGTYIGRRAVADHVFAVLERDWDGDSLELDEVVQEGDSVVGIGTRSGTNRATGRSFSARVVHLWRFRDGMVVGFEQVIDTAMVNEAIDR